VLQFGSWQGGPDGVLLLAAAWVGCLGATAYRGAIAGRNVIEHIDDVLHVHLSAGGGNTTAKEKAVDGKHVSGFHTGGPPWTDKAPRLAQIPPDSLAAAALCDLAFRSVR
jgi:hypothetical protein